MPEADFAAFARQFSEDPDSREAGGRLGIFAHGVHPPALDDAFFALKPGEAAYTLFSFQSSAPGTTTTVGTVTTSTGYALESIAF